MQLRTMLVCMLVVNGAVRCNESQTYYYEPYGYEAYYDEEITCDGYYVEDEYIDDCIYYDYDIDRGGAANDYYGNGASCVGEDEPWIPVFPPLYKVPTYSEIIALTNQNEALFNTQIAYADQALEAYLRQCIVNGAYDEQQIANLIDAIKNVYMVFVRQSAFLAYAKSIRLQDEAEYQAYQAQLAALQTAVQQAAQQAGDAWYAVVQGTESAADALIVSQNSAATIAADQTQMAQIAAQISALLAVLATEPYAYEQQ